ncbi:hypothetical protein [Fictibacillus gelatini]|uniref:hypothetical protein n=1 Tax=Fictibacillus gelatini TaxID=225985 RepID=UPI0004194E09|nr:hypothetical protein [Fictibacillus gelatini]
MEEFKVKINDGFGFIHVSKDGCLHVQLDEPEGIEEVCVLLDRDELVELKVKLEMYLESTR